MKWNPDQIPELRASTLYTHMADFFARFGFEMSIQDRHKRDDWCLEFTEFRDYACGRRLTRPNEERVRHTITHLASFFPTEKPQWLLDALFIIEQCDLRWEEVLASKKFSNYPTAEEIHALEFRVKELESLVHFEPVHCGDCKFAIVRKDYEIGEGPPTDVVRVCMFFGQVDDGHYCKRGIASTKSKRLVRT